MVEILKNQEVLDTKIKKRKRLENGKGNYEATNFKTIKETFINSTEKFKDKTFILEKFDHKEPFTEIKYAQFKDDVVNLGTGLTKSLNLKDEKIIIIGENTYHWYISYMAMLCGVGIAVPTGKESPVNEIENIIKRSKATAVIYSPKKKDIINAVKDKVTEVKYFIEMYSDVNLEGKDIGLENVIEQGKELVESGDNSFMNIEIDPDEFKVLLFTSGTTAESKGVMLCNRNLAENINAAMAYVRLDDTDRFISILPLHHTYESTVGFLIPHAIGASISVCEGLKYIVQNFKETKPTMLLAVPALIENLYRKINDNIEKSKKTKVVNSMIHVTNALKTVNIDIKKKVFSEIHNTFGGNLRRIVSAAAPISSKVGKWISDIGIDFIQGYGLTETAPIAALAPDFNPMIGSVGKAIICADLKIDKPNEKGEGEVLIKSETLMLGYYEDEKATKKAIDGKWFHSGDIGYLTKKGFLYLTGRSKNVIVTQNGKNIYPEEIELVLGKIQEIKECMVYGKKKDGEIELTISVKVIPNYEYMKEKYEKEIEKEEAHKIIWEEIKKVNKELTSCKAIKNLEIKEDEFEKTTTMKIKRFEEIEKKS